MLATRRVPLVLRRPVTRSVARLARESFNPFTFLSHVRRSIYNLLLFAFIMFNKLLLFMHSGFSLFVYTQGAQSLIFCFCVHVIFFFPDKKNVILIGLHL